MMIPIHLCYDDTKKGLNMQYMKEMLKSEEKNIALILQDLV